MTTRTGSRRPSTRPDQRQTERKPWLVRCAPGLARVALAELRFRKVIPRTAGATILRQRNHDLIFLGHVAEQLPGGLLRIPEELHVCPLFGRYKITQSQLDRLAGVLLARSRPYRLAVTADGAHFPRQETKFWLTHELQRRHVALTDDPAEENVLWMFCVEEAYYFGLSRFTAADADLRDRRVAERQGALPPTIAAALAFLGEPRPTDTILDPVCGTGTLLAEAHAYAPEAALIGVDRDADALVAARQNLAQLRRVHLMRGDGARTGLPAGSVSLVLANLPFGKQFGDRQTNRDLYDRLLDELERLAVPDGARAVLLTSDTVALEGALAARPRLKAQQRATVKVRGEVATITSVQLS
ncbi:MAG TPA: methyltransferase domain-containing protein [Thermomicrobiales bacterium]|nr:methyltransferase domain-containing protein [Thermomicrobiales bacterium]